MSQVYRHQHRVTYAECTVGNHIYYARYLNLLEAARGEFFRSLGASFQTLQDADTIFPVIECHLRYLAPARYDDVLSIEISIVELKGIRINFSYRVLNAEGKVLVEGTTQHVCTSIHEKPKRIPAELMEKLQPWVKGVEDFNHG